MTAYSETIPERQKKVPYRPPYIRDSNLLGMDRLETLFALALQLKLTVAAHVSSAFQNLSLAYTESFRTKTAKNTRTKLQS